METGDAQWAELKNVETRAWVAFLCALGIAGFGVGIIRELQAFEAGTIQEVRTFSWIVGLYEFAGLVGVGLGIAAFSLLSTGAGVDALRRRKALIAVIGEARYRAAQRKEDGNSTLRTLILLGVLVAILGVFAAFHFGWIKLGV